MTLGSHPLNSASGPSSAMIVRAACTMPRYLRARAIMNFVCNDGGVVLLLSAAPVWGGGLGGDAITMMAPAAVPPHIWPQPGGRTAVQLVEAPYVWNAHPLQAQHWPPGCNEMMVIPAAAAAL